MIPPEITARSSQQKRHGHHAIPISNKDGGRVRLSESRRQIAARFWYAQLNCCLDFGALTQSFTSGLGFPPAMHRHRPSRQFR